MSRTDFALVMLLAMILIECVWRWQSLPVEPVEIFAPQPSCSVFPEATGPLGRSTYAELYSEQFKIEQRKEIAW